jgi:hypothetical protein
MKRVRNVAYDYQSQKNKITQLLAEPANKVLPLFLKIKNKMAAFKTYVLLEHMHPSSKNMFIRINKDQRQPINKLRDYRPYMKVSFTDESGKNRTIRYKNTTSEIYQDEQIKLGILANEKFNQNEYRDLEFRNGVKFTDNETIQKYFETYPGIKGFKGRCNDVRGAEFEVYDKASETKLSNELAKKQVEAGAKIFAMDLEATQSALYRIFGSSYVPSDDAEENHSTLIEYLNSTDEAAGEILKENVNRDDEITILVGKLLTDGVISFDQKANQVSKKKGSTWIDVKAISNEYSPIERKRIFAEFLASDAGQPLLEEFKNEYKTGGSEVKKDGRKK